MPMLMSDLDSLTYHKLALMGITHDASMKEVINFLINQIESARDAERAACVADVEAELEYPSAAEQMTPKLAAMIQDHPEVAMQVASAETKKGILARIKQRGNST